MSLSRSFSCTILFCLFLSASTASCFYISDFPCSLLIFNFFRIVQLCPFLLLHTRCFFFHIVQFCPFLSTLSNMLSILSDFIICPFLSILSTRLALLDWSFQSCWCQENVWDYLSGVFTLWFLKLTDEWFIIFIMYAKLCFLSCFFVRFLCSFVEETLKAHRAWCSSPSKCSSRTVVQHACVRACVVVSRNDFFLEVF